MACMNDGEIHEPSAAVIHSLKRPDSPSDNRTAAQLSVRNRGMRRRQRLPASLALSLSLIRHHLNDEHFPPVLLAALLS